MKISIFGATGALGSECLKQALSAGHEVTVLVRSATKLSEELRSRVTTVEGDALIAEDVARVIQSDTEAILFAIGVDKKSPEDLCTDATDHIFNAMAVAGVERFIWCGGGSTLVEEDDASLGARIVEKIAQLFMALRHNDKEHQYALLQQHPEIDWLGVRPLQMRKGPLRGEYRLGFNTFSGMSKISFSDCAHAMLGMLEDDTWLRKAPIIQY
jgi:putative NADH-flavin reductase